MMRLQAERGMALLKKTIYLLVITFLILLFSPLSTGAAGDISKDTYLVDEENFLTEETKQEVKILGDKLKKGTTAQLVAMIIEHVGDQSASEFNMDIIRENQIGSVRNKNGLLFLIETDPVNGGGPAVEITVDRDLEKALSDAKIDQIIERYTMPYLNQGLIDEAVVSTYQALSNEVSKHYGITEGLTKPQPYTSNSLQDSISIPTIIIILLVIFLLSRMVNGKRKKQRD